jgi:3-isopropylmalate/(R)-2-methylmalate dehydratase small subunit
MDRFINLQKMVVPLDRANVDTDAIIPKQFLKRVTRTGFGANLFDEWRYLDHGEADTDCSMRPINTDFVLNKQRYKGAGILLTRENFGCGSSREHAPWALLEYGFHVIIAPSFADIFYNNCFKNGLLPVVLPAETVERLFNAVNTTYGYMLNINLEQQMVRTQGGELITFDLDPFHKHCLLHGLDEIALSMLQTEKIRAYEQRVQLESPWLMR